MRIRAKNAGSILLMAVGLLTIIGMLGATFLVVSHLDKKQNRALATAAPITMENVARSLLAELQTDRQQDLHFGADGHAYGGSTTPEDSIDYPHENVDKALASTEPLGAAPGSWKHITNLGKDTDFTYADVSTSAAELVDTDGDGTGDALLFDTGQRDAENRQYYAAVRMIDASAFVNVNTAFYQMQAPDPNYPMLTSYVSLKSLVGGLKALDVYRARAGTTSAMPAAYEQQYVIRPDNPDPNDGEYFLPFDTSDALALAWRGSDPDTANGRLHNTLGASVFASKRGLLTAHSASRIALPKTYGTTVRDRLRTDLNSDMSTALKKVNRLTGYYMTFWRMLGNFTDPAVKKTALQLAVNVIDYRDDDDQPTYVEAFGNVKIYGVERQPFLVEAGYKHVFDPAGGGTLSRYYAIELWNPYDTAIDMSGWELKVGSNTYGLQDASHFSGDIVNSINPGSRVVIVSDAGVVVDGAAQKTVTSQLTLKETVLVQRPTTFTKPGMAPVAQISPSDFTQIETDPDEDSPVDPADDAKHAVMETIHRCEQRDKALYSLALYDHFTSEDITGAASSQLGLAKTVTAGAIAKAGVEPKPHPVYVRNGDFINLAEMNRIYQVGPTETDPLDVVLVTGPQDPFPDPTGYQNGRLDYLSASTQGTLKGVPDGYRVPGYFTVGSPPDGVDNDGDGTIDEVDEDITVGSPQTDGVDNDGDGTADEADEDIVYGKVNINTMPVEGVVALPGIAETATGLQLIDVQLEIIAYRDMIQNPKTLNDYTGNRAPAGIAGLRDEPGFASSGEIAIPLAVMGQMKNFLPNNTYGNTVPNNYYWNNSDDGLPVGSGLSVEDDLTKRQVFYAWLSNQVTVRSDVYIAYIRVQIGGDADATTGVAYYVAMIDRSNCHAPGDVPRVRMFTKIK